jgi:hypothetical protein
MLIGMAILSSCNLAVKPTIHLYPPDKVIPVSRDCAQNEFSFNGIVQSLL